MMHYLKLLYKLHNKTLHPPLAVPAAAPSIASWTALGEKHRRERNVSLLERRNQKKNKSETKAGGSRLLIQSQYSGCTGKTRVVIFCLLDSFSAR